MGKEGGGFIIFWSELPNIGEMSISRRRKPEGRMRWKYFLWCEPGTNTGLKEKKTLSYHIEQRKLLFLGSLNVFNSQALAFELHELRSLKISLFWWNANGKTRVSFRDKSFLNEGRGRKGSKRWTESKVKNFFIFLLPSLSSFHRELPLETCLITHRGDISTGHGEGEQTDKKQKSGKVSSHQSKEGIKPVFFFHMIIRLFRYTHTEKSNRKFGH